MGRHSTHVQAAPRRATHRAAGRSRRSKLALTAAALVVLSFLGGVSTWSAFTGETSNAVNSFDAGTVDLTDDDGGAGVMFNVVNMAPGQTVTRCIKVTYTGTIAAKVALYAPSTGIGQLNPKLNVVVRRGSSTGTFPSCGTFTSDGTLTHPALTVATLPSTFETGLVGTDTSWVKDDAAVYEIAVTLDPSAGAAEEGQSGGPITFTWEARSF